MAAPERVIYKTVGTRELAFEAEKPAGWTASDNGMSPREPRSNSWRREGQPHGFFDKTPWQENTTALVDAHFVRLGYLEKLPEPATAPSGDSR